jgi:hypothetical protein
VWEAILLASAIATVAGMIGLLVNTAIRERGRRRLKTWIVNAWLYLSGLEWDNAGYREALFCDSLFVRIFGNRTFSLRRICAVVFAVAVVGLTATFVAAIVLGSRLPCIYIFAEYDFPYVSKADPFPCHLLEGWDIGYLRPLEAMFGNFLSWRFLCSATLLFFISASLIRYSILIPVKLYWWSTKVGILAFAASLLVAAFLVLLMPYISFVIAMDLAYPEKFFDGRNIDFSLWLESMWFLAIEPLGTIIAFYNPARSPLVSAQVWFSEAGYIALAMFMPWLRLIFAGAFFSGVLIAKITVHLALPALEKVDELPKGVLGGVSAGVVFVGTLVGELIKLFFDP